MHYVLLLIPLWKMENALRQKQTNQETVENDAHWEMNVL